MARVLTCTDPVPNSDGSCTSAVYLEQPSAWPALTVEQGKELGQEFMSACLMVLAVKLLLKPSTYRNRGI